MSLQANSAIVKIEIYTDGSSLGNPGQGGWWAIIIAEGKKKAISWGEPLTTNNRMELLAVIEALRYLQEKNAPSDNIIIYLDSKYVKQWVEWLPARIHKWRRLANKKPVANKDLREQLNVLLPHFAIHRQRVKWHANNEINNKVDKLARSAAAKQPIVHPPVKERHVIEKIRGLFDH